MKTVILVFVEKSNRADRLRISSRLVKEKKKESLKF